MTKHASRQATRLLALALAGGTVVALTSTGASAATGTTKHHLFANAKTSVVEVSLNLPAATPLVNELPAIGNLDLSKPVTLDLIQTKGSLLRNQITGVVDRASSVANLGAGTLFAKGGLLAQLNRTASAAVYGTQHTSSPAPTGIAFNQGGVLRLSAPTLAASAVSHLLSTAGDGHLAQLQLGHLTDLLPADILTQLNDALSQIIGDGSQGSGAVGTVTGIVDQLLSAINNALPSATAPVKQVLTDLQNQIDALQQALPKLVASLESGSIIDLDALKSLHNLGTSSLGDAVSSAASVGLAHLSLLDGFITLDGFNNSGRVTANGKAGGVGIIANPNVAKVHIGAPAGLDVVLGPNGLVATVLGDSQLPKTVTSLVNQLVSTISGLLSTVGVKIAPAQVVTEYFDAAGHPTTKANAVSGAVHGSGLQVLVNNPLNAANTVFSKALVGVKIGAFDAAAGAKAVTFATPHHPTPRVVPTPKGPLPHTGANLPLTAGAAITLLGSAALIRRRIVANKG